MTLSETRAALSDLVREIETLRKIAITVRGEVKAWLVVPGFTTRARRPLRPLRGSLKIVGDVEGFDASKALVESALRRAKRAGLT